MRFVRPAAAARMNGKRLSASVIRAVDYPPWRRRNCYPENRTWPQRASWNTTAQVNSIEINGPFIAPAAFELAPGMKRRTAAVVFSVKGGR